MTGPKGKKKTIDNGAGLMADSCFSLFCHLHPGLTATNQNCTNEGQPVVVKIVEEYIPCMTCMCKVSGGYALFVLFFSVRTQDVLSLFCVMRRPHWLVCFYPFIGGAFNE